MANIYNLARGITDAKNSWETHNASGNTIQRDKARDSAKPFYSDLEEAGRKDLADELKNANYEEAEKITARIYDELYGNKNENETLNAPTEMKPQGEPSPSPAATPLPEGEAEASVEGSTPSAEDTLNAVSGKNTPSDMIDDANAKADEYYNSVVAPKLEEDPFDSDYADAIFRVYNVRAEDAHDAALGDYTASNEGNVDSWSAAHAGRIYLDTLGRAIDKVTDYSEAEQNRLLNWYDRLTGNQLDLIDRSQTRINAERADENADADRESNERIEQAKLDSAEAINTENNDTNEYIADKNAEVTLEGYKTQESMNDANNASAEKINADDNATTIAINSMNQNSTGGGIDPIDGGDVVNVHYFGTYDENNTLKDEDGNSLIDASGAFVFDEDRAKKTGIDKYGKALITALYKKAADNAGYLTDDEIYEFVRDNSNAYDTNLNQIRKVYSYLGLNASKLENLEDAGFWATEWDMGVKEKDK